MSFLSPLNLLGEGVGDFEMFNLKDMWGKIEDDPWRLLTGSATPFGTELWNTVLGRDDDPMVNLLGGPMGSGWAGLGSGGVYDRAQAEGIDTKRANQLHDIAEVTAALFAGGAALGGGGGGAAGGGTGATTYPMPETGALGGGEYINAAGETIGGGGGAGLWDMLTEYSDLMGNMGGGMGGGQGGAGGAQQASDPPPQRRVMPSYSPYMPRDIGMPEVYSPQRSTPFGLLAQEDEMDRLRQILGGIL